MILVGLVGVQYNDANIQLLDLPGIIEGAAHGIAHMACIRTVILTFFKKAVLLCEL